MPKLTALCMSADGIGIDDGAAIYRADGTAHANRAVHRHFDFGDMRHVAPEDELE